MRCLVNGRHTSAEHAADCPLLGRTKQERIETWQAQQQKEVGRAEEE